MITMIKPRVPRIIELADMIAADIRRRKLVPGDQYQNTNETADMLGVSTTAANRAMQVLAKRKLIERRQRKGTFIAHAPTPGDEGDPLLTRLHVLVRQSDLKDEGLLSDGVIVGLHDELPDAQLSLDFLPAEDETKVVDNLIAGALRNGANEGFILVRASLGVQRQISESGLPAVVFGMLHPSVHPIPWIDRDHVEAGRLLVEHLLKNKVKRVLVLMRDRLLQGDHVLLDATRDTLHDNGLPLKSWTVRGLPNDHEAIVCSIAEWLNNTSDLGPAGIICRSEPLAKGAADAAARSRGKATVVLSDYYRGGFEPQPVWPHIRLALTPEQIGKRIGHMLARQARHEPVVPPHEIIGVQLER